MKEPSSAAQAVLNAALLAYDDEHLYTLSMKRHASMIAAAALRAAADQILPSRSDWHESFMLLVDELEDQ